MSLKAAQDIFSLTDVVNAVELKLDDINLADQVAAEADKLVGPKLAATTWMEQNKPILNALRMERIVTFITIGLLQTIGALNILIALIMMVMEKHKDIAILMSMGARHQQIRRVFVLEGLIIGSIGTALGLAVGYTISYLADKYQWIRLDEQVYSLAYVPFNARPVDALWIAAIAMFISFIATLYPARNATRDGAGRSLEVRVACAASPASRTSTAGPTRGSSVKPCAPSITAARTRPGCSKAEPFRWARSGWPSSTSPAAISRCSAEVTPASYSTARSTTTRNCATS